MDQIIIEVKHWLDDLCANCKLMVIDFVKQGWDCARCDWDKKTRVVIGQTWSTKFFPTHINMQDVKYPIKNE